MVRSFNLADPLFQSFERLENLVDGGDRIRNQDSAKVITDQSAAPSLSQAESF